MLDIKFTEAKTLKEKPADETKLGFGKIFTDYMFVMNYDKGQGWHDLRIEPYHPFEIAPGCVVLHYAQEVFEGLKAYRTKENVIQLFRPDCNAERMQDSCERLCIPKVPKDDFIQAVKALVEVEKDWVPHSEGASLYIRPFVFASMEQLGVHASTSYIFCIILFHRSCAGAHLCGRRVHPFRSGSYRLCEVRRQLRRFDQVRRACGRARLFPGALA